MLPKLVTDAPRIYRVLLKLKIKKVTNERITPRDKCNWKNKKDYPFNGKFQTSDIIYACIASTAVNRDKIYLETAERNFEKRYYNHKASFEKQKKGKLDPPLEICIESKVQIHRNVVLKVVSRKVCPRIFKYHQQVLAMS